MPTLDDVYRKYGEAAEAGQLLETELGTQLLDSKATREGLMQTPNRKRAKQIINLINEQTMGRLINEFSTENVANEDVTAMLRSALKARNRLSHSFYREHNLRKFSDAGRQIMMDDLESLHKVILSAYKAVMLLVDIDLDQIEKISSDGNQSKYGSKTQFTDHLPI